MVIKNFRKEQQLLKSRFQLSLRVAGLRLSGRDQQHDLVPECISIKTATTLLRESMYAGRAEQSPARKALAIADTLSQLSFNIQFLRSEKYVLNKLQTLKAKDIVLIKEAFIQNNTPRFMKYFFTHKPYGKKKLFVEKLMKARPERLTHLTKVCGLLLQTKVYLFWHRS